MSNEAIPPQPGDSTKSEEIPLEDIDKLLELADPGFNKSLEEVRNVEIDKNVLIEATITDGEMNDDAVETESAWRKFRTRIRLGLYAFRQKFKLFLKDFGKNSLIFLKTKPKEYILYALAMSKIMAKNAAIPIVAFKNAERAQKILFLILVAMAAGSVWILLANFKGIWLPQLTEPILRSLDKHADWVEMYDPKEAGESFYTAFPQERYEFLFPKMKVNLKRTSENPNPMGAFELIVLLDSKDTGIEVRDREVELSDLLQRVFEEESFNDLETEMGKSKLKSRLKREMNQKLTQGWVKDISFKTFILKP